LQNQEERKFEIEINQEFLSMSKNCLA